MLLELVLGIALPPKTSTHPIIQKKNVTRHEDTLHPRVTHMPTTYASCLPTPLVHMPTPLRQIPRQRRRHSFLSKWALPQIAPCCVWICRGSAAAVMVYLPGWNSVVISKAANLPLYALHCTSVSRSGSTLSKRVMHNIISDRGGLDLSTHRTIIQAKTSTLICCTHCYPRGVLVCAKWCRSAIVDVTPL